MRKFKYMLAWGYQITLGLSLAGGVLWFLVLSWSSLTPEEQEAITGVFRSLGLAVGIVAFILLIISLLCISMDYIKEYKEHK